MMKTIAPRFTNIIFKKEALVTEDTVPLTKKYLSMLRQYNIPVFLYDTREQCNTMKYAINRYMNNNNSNYNKNNNKNNCITNEKLQEIYTSILKNGIAYS